MNEYRVKRQRIYDHDLQFELSLNFWTIFKRFPIHYSESQLEPLLRNRMNRERVLDKIYMNAVANIGLGYKFCMPQALTQ